MKKIEEQTLVFEEDTMKNKYLTFMLEDESYGIEIRYVTEIIGIQPITGIPEVPDYVKGIVNLRGKIIPVIDVRLKFRKNPVEYDDRTCIVVVDIHDSAIGLIVDQVTEVLAIPEEQVAPPPDSRTGFQNRYIKGIGKVGQEVKLLLDCDTILTEQEQEAIEAIQ